jgi:5-formyltetrahydrofolate cyclo-ligase
MLSQELINLLGLARRARKIAVGNEATQEALNRRQAALVIVATDLSASAQKHWAEKYAGVPQLQMGTKNEWGEFWGRKEVGVMAVKDKNLAQGILRKLDRPHAIFLSKKALRTQMRQIRRALPESERERASSNIMQRLMPLEAYQRAQAVHTYVSWRDEADTHALIRVMRHEGRRVIVPKVQQHPRTLLHFSIDDFSMLVPGAFGILEPSEEKGAQPAAADIAALVIVPGLAFDRQGHRLGYGAGYYDHFLAEISAPKIALAFAAQIVEEVPAAAHDQRVDFVVTENEVIVCGSFS